MWTLKDFKEGKIALEIELYKAVELNKILDLIYPVNNRNIPGAYKYYFGISDISYPFSRSDTKPSIPVIKVKEFYDYNFKQEKMSDIIKIRREFLEKALEDANPILTQVIKGAVDPWKLTILSNTLLAIYNRNDICEGWKTKLELEYPEILEDNLVIKKGIFDSLSIKEAVAFNKIVFVKDYGISIADGVVQGENLDYLRYRSFYLSNSWRWEIIVNKRGDQILVPYKK